MKNFALIGCLVLLGGFSSRAFAGETYKVDPVHSSVIFRIGHANIGVVYGRINDAAGSFSIDADPAKNTFELELQVAKIDTNQPKREEHLRSPDFFNAKQYPTITFKSTSVKKGEGKMLEVSGDLTVHGVTKSITIPVEIIGEGDFAGTHRVGLEAIFTIKRSDFDMKGVPMVGDDVRLMVALEGAK